MDADMPIFSLLRRITSGQPTILLFIGGVFLILVYLVGSPLICLLLSSLK